MEKLSGRRSIQRPKIARGANEPRRKSWLEPSWSKYLPEKPNTRKNIPMASRKFKDILVPITFVDSKDLLVGIFTSALTALCAGPSPPASHTTGKPPRSSAMPRFNSKHSRADALSKHAAIASAAGSGRAKANSGGSTDSKSPAAVIETTERRPMRQSKLPIRRNTTNRPRPNSPMPKYSTSPGKRPTIPAAVRAVASGVHSTPAKTHVEYFGKHLPEPTTTNPATQATSAATE